MVTKRKKGQKTWTNSATMQPSDKIDDQEGVVVHLTATPEHGGKA